MGYLRCRQVELEDADCFGECGMGPNVLAGGASWLTLHLQRCNPRGQEALMRLVYRPQSG
jgi:hypothetical protein